MKRTIFFLGILFLASVCALSQTETNRKAETGATTQQTFRATPAYAELLLKKTEYSAELESLILEYTEDYPKVKDIRHGLTLVDRESARLARVKPVDLPKLTLALGKLMSRKIDLEIDLWNLQKNYKDEHPEVKRAKRKVEIYELAIAEVLN
ncbi:MAG TPA: hypothetical protein VFZ23_14995 [Pyrinomonadaceae bacterium]